MASWEYSASRRLAEAFLSKVAALEFRKNEMPHPSRAGSPRRRSCSAESERKNDDSNIRQLPGVFHGSAILGVNSAPFAKLVWRPGPSSLSITTTSYPRHFS